MVLMATDITAPTSMNAFKQTFVQIIKSVKTLSEALIALAKVVSVKSVVIILNVSTIGIPLKLNFLDHQIFILSMNFE